MAAKMTGMNLPAPFPSILSLQPPNHSPISNSCRSQTSNSSLVLSTRSLSSSSSTARKTAFSPLPPKKKPKFGAGRAIAASGEEAQLLTSESAPAEIVSTSGDDTASAVIQVLLFVAFVGLSILSAGVIYLGVTDFLQKREKEKLEKEEADKKKKKQGGKKVRVRARAGPKGFGQKIDQGEDVDDGS